MSVPTNEFLQHFIDAAQEMVEQRKVSKEETKSKQVRDFPNHP